MDPALADQAFPENARMAELATAVAASDLEGIKRLAPGLDLDARGDKDVTLLQWAILNRKPDAFSALLDAGADPRIAGISRNSAIHTAARVNTSTFLETLLQRDVPVDLPHAATQETPLAAAVGAGRHSNIEVLLAAGADVDAADRMGNTPLHVAGKAGDASIALLLLNSGAQSHLRNAQDNTFDHYLFLGDAGFLTVQARSELDEVRALLSARGNIAPET